MPGTSNYLSTVVVPGTCRRRTRLDSFEDSPVPLLQNHPHYCVTGLGNVHVVFTWPAVCDALLRILDDDTPSTEEHIISAIEILDNAAPYCVARTICFSPDDVKSFGATCSHDVHYFCSLGGAH